MFTFLFTDVEGSTNLLERFGAAYGPLLDATRATIEAAAAAHGGISVEVTGDAIHLRFTSAREALDAALEAQLRLRGQDGVSEMKVRMGIHAGDAEPSAAGLVGVAIHEAARICAAAHGGQILISDTVRGLLEALPEGAEVTDLGEYELKDIPGPRRLFQVAAPGLLADFPALRAMPSGRSNLPAQLTSFIGRDDDLERLRGLMSQSRLVTVAGPGGAGKTRLALEAAAASLDGFLRICLVELGPVTRPGLVAAVTANALGLKEGMEDPAEVLRRELREQSLLLLLDNCEHVLQEAAELAASLVAACSRLHLLTTSREPLGVTGEVVFRVPPLSEEDSRRLLAERAAAGGSGFVVDEQNEKAVAAICTHLDGIPLAIELAAARLSTLAPAQVLERLTERFSLLSGGSAAAPPRQRTLRAAMSWSHDLLEPFDQAAFRRLAVMPGSFDLEAADAVAAGAPVDSVLDSLHRLAGKSLLVVDQALDGSAARYRFLETVRAFGLERLRESEEEAGCRRRHAEHYLVFASAVPREQPQRLLNEQENLRAAADWALENEPQLAVRLATAIGWHFGPAASPREGLGLFAKVLAAWPAADEARLSALFEAGWVAVFAGQIDLAETYLNEQIALARRLGLRQKTAQGLQALGWSTVANRVDRPDLIAQAVAGMEEALSIFLDLEDHAGAAGIRFNLGMHALLTGQLDRAHELMEGVLSYREETSDWTELSQTYMLLGGIEVGQGDLVRARDSVKKGTELALRMRDGRALAFLVLLMSLVWMGEGDVEEAVRLLECSESYRRREGLDDPGIIAAVLGPIFEARSALPPEDAQRLAAEGAALEPADALAAALALPT